MKSIINRFFSVVGAKVWMLGLSLIITPVLVRFLGSAGYGDFAFILSLFGIGIVIVNAGIFHGIRKFIAENNNDPDWENHVFGFYFRLAGFLSILVTIVICAAVISGLVSDILGSRFNLYFYILSLIILSQQFFLFARGTLMGFGLEQISELVFSIRKLIFGCLAIILASFGWGVAGVLFSKFIAILIAAVVLLIYSCKHVSYKSIYSPLPDEFPRKKLMTYNTHSTIFLLLTISLYHVDIILLQPLAGSEAVGLYRAALVIAEFIWFVPTAIQVVLLQSTSELWSNEENYRITQIATRVTRYTLLFTTLLAIGLIALANQFIPLYFGAEFTPAITPLLLLLPGVIGFATARPIFSIGLGKGDLKILIYATGTAAILNIILNLILIPQYSIHGAAIATSIGYGSMLFLHMWSARRIGFNPLADLRLLKVGITAVISAPLIIGLSEIIESSILSLVIIPPIGFMIYSALAIKSGAIKPEEINQLLGKLPSSLQFDRLKM